MGPAASSFALIIQCHFSFIVCTDIFVSSFPLFAAVQRILLNGCQKIKTHVDMDWF
jgi:hypothetical protein